MLPHGSFKIIQTSPFPRSYGQWVQSQEHNETWVTRGCRRIFGWWGTGRASVEFDKSWCLYFADIAFKKFVTDLFANTLGGSWGKKRSSKTLFSGRSVTTTSHGERLMEKWRHWGMLISAPDSEEKIISTISIKRLYCWLVVRGPATTQPQVLASVIFALSNQSRSLWLLVVLDYSLNLLLFIALIERFDRLIVGHDLRYSRSIVVLD